MPKIVLSPQHLAVARILAGDNWTHGRIGALLGVSRSTVSHGLKWRKTLLPSRLDEIAAQVLAGVVTRTDRAARRAVASELRVIARELETEDQNQTGA
jgi:predicted transcriptional regulator